MPRLSSEQFESIIRSLRSDLKVGGGEKRSMPRVGLRARLDIIPTTFGDEGAKRLTVWLRDISANGLGIVSSHFMSKKTEFVAIFNSDQNKCLKVPYMVMHCTTISKGLFCIGAEMINAGETK